MSYYGYCICLVLLPFVISQPRQRELQSERQCHPSRAEDPIPVRNLTLVTVQGRWFATNVILSRSIPKYRSLYDFSDFSLDFNASGIVVADASIVSPWSNGNARVCLYETTYFRLVDDKKNAYIQHSFYFNQTMEWRLLKSDFGRSYLVTWTCVVRRNGRCVDFMSHIHSRTPHYLTEGQLRKINRYTRRTMCLDVSQYTADPIANRCKRYKDLDLKRKAPSTNSKATQK